MSDFELIALVVGVVVFGIYVLPLFNYYFGSSK